MQNTTQQDLHQAGRLIQDGAAPSRIPNGMADTFRGIHRPAHLLDTALAEAAMLHTDQWGFFAIGCNADGTKNGWRESRHRLDKLSLVVSAIGATPDTYISQAEFAGPRRLTNLRRLKALWVDFDYYRINRFAGHPAQHFAELILLECRDKHIPPPSYIVDSGRGIYAKWILDTAIPQCALPRWQLVQNALFEHFKPHGADPSSRDATRVLRVVGSTNSKSKQPVRVIWENTLVTEGGTPLANGLTGYPFDVIANTVLPWTREETAAIKALWARESAARLLARGPNDINVKLGSKPHNSSGLRTFRPTQLAWDRYHDVIKLLTLRGWQRGAPEGNRDLPLFLCAVFLAQAVRVSDLEAEVVAIARRVAPTWSKAEVDSCVTSVMARANDSAAGKKTMFNGIEQDPRYRYSNRKIIDLLAITADEQAQLATIIDKAELARRDRARAARKRAEQGAQPRADYLEQGHIKRAHAHQLRTEGMSWSEVGKSLGVSAGAARMLASRNMTERTSPSVCMEVA